MINLASPELRIALAQAKSTAMLGSPDDAITMLNSRISTSPERIDQLVAMVAICEILHWDYRDTEALRVFD